MSCLYSLLRRETFKHYIVSDNYMDYFINNECGKVICFCQCESNKKHWHLLCNTIPLTARKLTALRATYVPKIKKGQRPIEGHKIECLNHFKNAYHYIMNNCGGHSKAQNIGKSVQKMNHKHITCSSTFSGILASNKGLTEYGFNHDILKCSCNWAKKQRFYVSLKGAPSKVLVDARRKYIKRVNNLNTKWTDEKCFPNWDLLINFPKRGEIDPKFLFNKD